LCANLVERGFEVHVATNGDAAFDLARKEWPDAILLDGALSAMDRWQAVKRLNTESGTSRIPVLTLEAGAPSPDGFERVIGKIHRAIGELPVPRDQVPTTPIPLRRSRQPATETPTVSQPAATAAEQARTARRVARILVVDDHPTNRELLLRRLEKAGYTVTIAESGEEALDRLRAESFDLVLLDWMMPGMSGIEVLRRVRATRSPIELPVIMATARSEPDDIVEALRAEANDYVSKPLNFEIVIARIRAQIGLAEAHRELAASERRFRALLENTSDLIVQFRPDGDVLYVSPASRTLLGFAPEDLAKKSFFDWLHPIDRRALETHLKDRANLPRAYTFIARMQSRDARWVWIETNVRVLQEGGHTLHQAACRDVTEHMDAIAGDEPPLPLGGDVIAHPGWRATVSRAPAPDRKETPRDGATGSAGTVVVTTVVDRGGMSAEEIGQRVTDAVRRALHEVEDA
jgi:PAS domain S-box-containing protein